MNVKNTMTSAQHYTIMNALQYLGYMLFCGPLMVVMFGLSVVCTMSDHPLGGVLFIGGGILFLVCTVAALNGVYNAYVEASSLYSDDGSEKASDLVD